ncbi:uncharacterized protein LOC119674094 [Teleopsis dalmanni]|uniref:uncharacterized protein LOC119674094 n=1 Tax=Teleopsis dalmanni TaxID=139649 RepID=UPI0018CC7E4D|nr:uncharacterized protein LOC119674094 [Teleopsis dalmanni]
MWTYMMAASRGERANSMMSSRRRNETESPKYGINLSRPMYRTTRLSGLSNTATTSFGSTYPYTTTQYGTGINLGNSGATAATIHTHSNAKDTPMLHTKTKTKHHQHRRHHHRNGNEEHCHTTVEGIEDGTSLFSPLTPSTTMTKDINLYSCKSSAVHGMVRKQLIANHTGDTTTNIAASTSSGHRSGVTSAAVLHVPTYDSDDDEISISDGKYALHHHQINEDVGSSNSSDDDEDEEENIEMQEVQNLESGIEKGKKISMLQLHDRSTAYDLTSTAKPGKTGLVNSHFSLKRWHADNTIS